jgi:uncharacterized hydrophobic protein (TIGR00271 family)
MTANRPALHKRVYSRFDLRPDQADHPTIDATIRDGVELKGTNLWVLIFAIFIASIGLNVNSAAVVIGAMLISPLMGPIMGLGYGAGINDSKLIRKALFNLGLTAIISLVTSTLYFLITPLTQAESELIARTTPSIWDVLIALFGGLAGMIGATRKVKSNLVPGVAIATALMPPLCTAGYGLATRNADFFFGALYLFSINSVFIAYATLLMVRVMKLPKVEWLPGASVKWRRAVIAAIVLVTVVPSVYLAIGLVRQEVFRSNAASFVTRELHSRTDVLVVGYTADAATQGLRVNLVGKRLSADTQRALAQQLANYGLAGVKLDLVQSFDSAPDASALKPDLLAEFVGNNRQELNKREQRITELQQQLQQLQTAQAQRLPLTALLRELQAQFPDARDITVAQGESLAPAATGAGASAAMTDAPGTALPAASASASAPGSGSLPAPAALPVLVVQLHLYQPLPEDEVQRLRKGLAARFNLGRVDLEVTLHKRPEAHRRPATRSAHTRR